MTCDTVKTMKTYTANISQTWFHGTLEINFRSLIKFIFTDSHSTKIIHTHTYTNKQRTSLRSPRKVNTIVLSSVINTGMIRQSFLESLTASKASSNIVEVCKRSAKVLIIRQVQAKQHSPASYLEGCANYGPTTRTNLNSTSAVNFRVISHTGHINGIQNSKYTLCKNKPQLYFTRNQTQTDVFLFFFVFVLFFLNIKQRKYEISIWSFTSTLIHNQTLQWGR